MDETNETEEVFTFRDPKQSPDIFHKYDKTLKHDKIPIVIDNGSYQCRVGWAVDTNPRLVFRNLMAKIRKEKGKSDFDLLVGNDITNFEAVRFQLKSAFDRDVITNLDTAETILDYSFGHLGIDTQGSVEHPVVLTETVCNPIPARQTMNELLFECYQVPAISLGVDALFSLQKNFSKPYKPLPSAMVVRLGYQTSHIIPVLGGKADSQGIRRINHGGLQMISYLHRLLQLKYPTHLSAITFSRAEELLHDYAYIAEDYLEELDNWADGDFYEKQVRKIQLPFTPAPGPSGSSMTQEQQQQRRKENVRRLVEMNARKREERLAADEERLESLQIITNQLSEVDDVLASKLLRQVDIADEHQLEQEIQLLQERITKTRQKMATASNENAPEEGEARKPTDTAEFQEWLDGIRKQRTEILSRRRERQQRRQELTKRKSAAAQERMRILSMLAKTGGTGSNKKKEDTFGMRDEDWDIYKAVSKDGGGSDSEAEQEKLNDLEAALKRYDPNFKSYSGSLAGGESGTSGFVPTAEFYQLHVGVERIRAPEIFFQPSMIGSVQAGITETLDYVVKLYDAERQAELMSNIFITGGCANLPGMVHRMERELRAVRPFQSVFNVHKASDPSCDAWKGACDFAKGAPQEAYFTKAQYQECGSDYFIDHFTSNHRYVMSAAE